MNDFILGLKKGGKTTRVNAVGKNGRIARKKRKRKKKSLMKRLLVL